MDRRGGRNSRRNRGGRGRGYSYDDWDDGYKNRYAYRGRGGPPPGLKGRQIGLWYAQRGRQRQIETEQKQRPLIAFDGQRELSMSLKWLTEQFGDDDGVEFDTAPNVPVDVAWRVAPAKDKEAAPNSASFSEDSTVCIDDLGEEDDDGSEFAESIAPGASYEPNAEYPSDKNGISQEQAIEMEGTAELTEEELELSELRIGGQMEESFLLPKSLPKNIDIDEKLRQMSEIRHQSDKVKKFLEFRKSLPAYQRQKDFVKLIKDKRVVVVSGLTGCGKSTQLPQALLDEMIEVGDGSRTRIVCTQPRRISAISLAERVADERGENLRASDKTSRSVGYQIRLECRLPRDHGSLLYCTTGIVLRWLTVDPMLSGISHLFLDEIHERDLQSDLLLILVRDLLKHRSDLRLILMSATLEAETFLNYFSEYGAALFEIEGRSFPVQPYFLEDVYERIRYQPNERSRTQYGNLPIWKRRVKERRMADVKKKRQLQIRALRDKKYSERTSSALEDWQDDEEKIDPVLIRELTRHICDTSKPDGAILIFVPGSQDIKDVIGQFKKDPYFGSSRFVLLPLHSLIPTSDQQKVFLRPPHGCRKIIISTNIAETSVTIDDVVYVIDSGKIKRQNFDKESNCLTLRSEWVSKANAVQRQGRAGRCQAGVCFHLFPSWKFGELDDRSEPEMCRTRLTSLCLDIKDLTKSFSAVEHEDKSVLKFLRKAVDPPDEESVKLALDDLYAMGALTSEEEVTPLGWHLLRFPVDPHCAKMIIFSAIYSCVDPVLTIAACLDYKVPFYQPIGMEAQVDECKKMLQWPSDGVKSDYLMWVTAFNEWAWATSQYESDRFAYDNFLSVPTMKFIDKMKRQFAEVLFTAGFTASADPMDPGSNKNSNAEKAIHAVVASGLYPKVAFVMKQVDQRAAASSRRPPSLRIKSRQRVKIHPSSVNNDVPYFETPYLVYHTSVKSTALYLRECAMVSPLALCLAGGNLSRGVDTVILDEWIRLYADDAAYVILREMRRLMRLLLKGRLETPSSKDDQDMSEAEGKLIHVVCHALSRERLMFKSF